MTYNDTPYYACIDPSTREVQYVFSTMGTPDNSAATFVSITKDQLGSIMQTTPCTLSESGVVSAYDKPLTSDQIKKMAQAALDSVMAQSSMIVAMGETFGDKTKAYIAALKAIINGSDTKSTSLPTAPSDLTS